MNDYPGICSVTVPGARTSRNEAIRNLAQDWVMASDSVAQQLVSAVKRALFGEKGKAPAGNRV